MPPRKKAAAKKAVAPVVPETELVEVTAVPYTEDDDWDGTPEMTDAPESAELVNDDSIATDEDAPTSKRRGRVVSPLIVATREFEKANKEAAKARKAKAKVQPLIDSLDELEKVEQEKYQALQDALANVGGN